MRVGWLAGVLAIGVCTLLPACATSPGAEGILPKVPYVPTGGNLVDHMIDMAQVSDKDVVYDLGCGDGRIVITAAATRGARGVGIDIDHNRIHEAELNRRRAGVGDKVRFVVGDLFQSDFSEATVVMLYLLPEVNLALRPLLWRQLRVGTRVVSHDFDMGPDWPPDEVRRLGRKVLYKWTIRQEHKQRAS